MSNDGIREKQAARLQFLLHFYDSVGDKPLVRASIYEVGAELGYANEEALSIARYLIDEGYMQLVAGLGRAELTHTGIKVAEQALLEPDEPSSEFPPVNDTSIEIHGDRNVVQVGKGHIVKEGSSRDSQVEPSRSRKFLNWILRVVVGGFVIGVLVGLAILIIEYRSGLFLPQQEAPTSQHAESLVPTPSFEPQFLVPRTDNNFACLPGNPEQPGLSITEVMTVTLVPIGQEAKDQWYEYVEIYNYGDDSIDINGWFIEDNQEADELVAWDSRFRGIPVHGALTETTCLAPGKFALILAAGYERGDMRYKEIPSETIILTVKETLDIGDGLTGRENEEPAFRPDALALYFQDSEGEITVVSTYGTPEDNEDDLPKVIPVNTGWGGFRKRFPEGEDFFSNWVRFQWNERTPGYFEAE